MLIQLAPLFLLFGGLVVFRERFAPLQWAASRCWSRDSRVFFHDRLAEVFAIGRGSASAWR